MDLDTSLLRAFLTVARAGSINRAAARLSLTQPALSQRIRGLETQLGHRVFSRSPRGIALTAAGEALLPAAERMVALADQLVPGLDAAAGSIRQRRSIGLLEDTVGWGLATVLAEFAAIRPSLELRVVTGVSPRLGEAYAAGELDLLIADTGEMPMLEERPRNVWRCPLVWAGAPDWPNRGEPLPLVMFSAPCQWRDRMLTALDGAGIAWRIVFESSSLQAVQAALRAGLGVVALLPDTIPAGVARARGIPLPALPGVELGLYVNARFAEDPILRDLARLFLGELSAAGEEGMDVS